MAEAADPTTTEVSEEQQRSWRDEFAEQWLNVRLGLEGMMLDKWQKQTAAALDIAKRTRDGTLGKSDAAATEPDEMGVSIGNKTFITMPADPPAQQPAGMSTLAKVGVGAALTAAGVGLPAAGFAVGTLLDNDPPAVVAPADPATDRDTYLPYDFGIE